MKRAMVTVLVFVLGLALFGCGSPSDSSGPSDSNGADNASQSESTAGSSAALDRSFAMAGGDITFNVSSSWNEKEGAMASGMQEYIFQTGNGTFSITYYSNDTSDPFEGFESMQKLYAESYGVTAFKELSRDETTRDGMDIVVFEYSYNDPQDGDTIERLAYISRGESRVVIIFLDYADRFDPSSFDELLGSLLWK